MAKGCHNELGGGAPVTAWARTTGAGRAEGRPGGSGGRRAHRGGQSKGVSDGPAARPYLETCPQPPQKPTPPWPGRRAAALTSASAPGPAPSRGVGGRPGGAGRACAASTTLRTVVLATGGPGSPRQPSLSTSSAAGGLAACGHCASLPQSCRGYRGPMEDARRSRPRVWKMES